MSAVRALFESAVGSEQDRWDINPYTRRADPGEFTVAPLLPRDRCIDCRRLVWRGSRAAAPGFGYTDFSFADAAHPGLRRGDLRYKARKKGQKR